MRLLKHPVSKKLLVQLGDITVSFALLESEIQSLAGILLSSDQRTGQIVTAELAFQKLRSLVVSLYLHRYGKDANYDEFRDLVRRAGQVEGKRNSITHSLWAAGQKRDTVTRIKTTAKEKHGLKFDFEAMDENQLGDLATAIKALASDFQCFTLKLVGITMNPNNRMKSNQQ